MGEASRLADRHYNRRLAGVIAVAATAVIVGACTSGGGGGGGGGTPGTSDTPSARNWLTAEYRADYGKPQIDAAAAYEAGATGSVRVAVIDGLIDSDHPEFEGRVRGCYDSTAAPGNRTGCNGSERYRDDHATRVAGTLAAARDDEGMHGVAFRSRLYSVDIFGSKDGTTPNTNATSADNQAAGLQWALNRGVAAMNHSYATPIAHSDYSASDIEGFYGTSDSPRVLLEAYQRAASSGVPMVFAAGNAGLSEPSLQAALPRYYSELRDVWLAVAASTPDRELASYSNACGAARAWCLMAPGGVSGDPLRSTTVGGGYGNAIGTSFAAPHVTGAIALLIDLFGPGTPSNLSAEEIVAVVLETADRDIPGYRARLHGQGLLDVAAALTPDAERASIPSGGDPQGEGGRLTSSRMTLGPAFGDAVRAEAEGLGLVAFDPLNRAIPVSLASLTDNANGTGWDARSALSRFGDAGRTITHGQPGLPVSLTTQAIPGDTGNLGPEETFRMSLDMQVSPGNTLSASHNVGPGEAIASMTGTTGIGETDLLDADPLTVPYLGFAERGVAVGGSMNLATAGAGQFTWRAFSGEEAAASPDAGNRAPAARVSADGIAAEWRTSPVDGLTVGLHGGVVVEDETILGAAGSGALATDGATTSFIGISGAVELTERISVHAGYDFGVSSAEGPEGSIIDGLSNVRSDAVRLGIAGRAWREDDRFALVVSQPLRVQSGEASVRLPTGRDDDGRVMHDRHTLDLEPTGREINLQASYGRPLAVGDIAAGALVRLQPGHDRSADPEAAAMVRYRLTF